MNILKDMDLFVRVVDCDGMAAAGRELGMTPSSVTMRLKNLESHYQVKLLTRTTRSINLTESGREFYQESVRMLDQANHLEHRLKLTQNIISGPIRITTTSDLGSQHIAPLIDDFTAKHPSVTPFLSLTDSVLDLVANNIDVAIRYGVYPSAQLVSQKLANSRRVLVASPDYLARAGVPKIYTDLKEHSCLARLQLRSSQTKWYFITPQGERSINVCPSRSSDDGAQIRQWAIEGAGIALKSIWDIANDLRSNRLVTLLDDYSPDYQSKKMAVGTDLYITYPDRKYVPNRIHAFVEQLQSYFEKFTLADKVL